MILDTLESLTKFTKVIFCKWWWNHVVAIRLTPCDWRVGITTEITRRNTDNWGQISIGGTSPQMTILHVNAYLIPMLCLQWIWKFYDEKEKIAYVPVRRELGIDLGGLGGDFTSTAWVSHQPGRVSVVGMGQIKVSNNVS